MEAKDDNNVIRITWNDRVKAFECKSNESSKLSMATLACRREIECSLVKFCFDDVSKSLTISIVSHHTYHNSIG